MKKPIVIKITIEGPQGCGKSTIAGYLRKIEHETRYPLVIIEKQTKQKYPVKKIRTSKVS